MALNGLTDLIETVSVPKSEYENLIRESETLDILRTIFRNQKYIAPETIRDILGVEYLESEE